MTTTSASARSHRPRSYTVFGAALVAGAAAAFGINSVLDAHLARVQPRVESEPILVAIRTLQAGAPVTVWDVALRDWPKAMVPSSAMRLGDDLDNLVVRHPLREGQPILAVQLARIDPSRDPIPQPVAVAVPPPSREPERDLWEPQTPAAPPTGTVGTSAQAVPSPAPVVPSSTPVVTSPAPVVTSPAPVVVVARAPQPPVTSPQATVVPPRTPDPVGPTAPESFPEFPAASVAASAVTAAAPESPESTSAPVAPADDGREDRPMQVTERLVALPVPAEVPPARVEPAPANPLPIPPTPREEVRPRLNAGTRRPTPSSVQFRSVPDRVALNTDVSSAASVEDAAEAPAPAPKPIAETASVLSPAKTPTDPAPSAARQRAPSIGQGTTPNGRSGAAKPAARTGQRPGGFTKGYRAN